MSKAQRLEDIEPGDMTALSAALAAVDTDNGPIGDEDTNKDETPEPEAKPAAQAEPEAKAGASSGTEDAGKPTGVLMKDGKTVIPYGVLTGEREARRAAEARTKELEQAIEQMKAAGDKPGDKATAAAALFTEEEMAELADDFPALKKLADAYTAQQRVVADLNEKLAQRQEPRQQASHTDEADDLAAARTEEAIAATPLIAKWRDKGGALFAEAVELDKELMADPAWVNQATGQPVKPLIERFNEVQQRIAAKYDIPIPSKAPSPAQAKSKPAQPTRTEELEPQSLSDLNGKTPVSERDATNAMSATELKAKFDSMSSDQINAWLARAG